MNPKTNTAIGDVILEREKQRLKWGNDHDDRHGNGELADVAALLAFSGTGVLDHLTESWGLRLREKHENDDRKRLVIAAALLLAEIERLDRMSK